MATADLTVIALGRPDLSASPYIAEIQRRLAAQDRVRYRLHAMGTSLEGTVDDVLAIVRELQAIGFTLNDAVDALAAHDAGGATCESERWRLQAVLDRVDARLAELTALRSRIVDAQDACASGNCVVSLG